MDTVDSTSSSLNSVQSAVHGTPEEDLSSLLPSDPCPAAPGPPAPGLLRQASDALSVRSLHAGDDADDFTEPLTALFEEEEEAEAE
ncbi:hypothetical protein MNEG_9608, partial [Monoraphidium neglectum]